MTIRIHAGSLGFDGAFRGILSLIPTTAINIQNKKKNKTTGNNNKKVCQYNVQWAAQQALAAVLYKVNEAGPCLYLSCQTYGSDTAHYLTDPASAFC
jgi:hypothetical protein